MKITTSYRGRFAPSPSGPLHFGSLVSALASFLQARSKAGEWLLRIEDIDPPREVAGSSELIIRALEAYGLLWDGTIIYQSNRVGIYEDYLQNLHNTGNTFFCNCTRETIKQFAGIYPGTCISRNLNTASNTSIRYKSTEFTTGFVDQLLGETQFKPQDTDRNFVLKRKDGLFAYQLAVVVDDMLQGITEVVRGVDLLDSTPKQIQLFNSFLSPAPNYFHHPLVINSQGQKVSKQNQANPINIENPLPGLIEALQFLGQTLPEDASQASVSELLQWAINHWLPASVPHQQKVL